MGFPDGINLDPGQILGTVVGGVVGAATGALALTEASAILGFLASRGSHNPVDWTANYADEVRAALKALNVSGYGMPLVAFADALRGKVSPQDWWNALADDYNAVRTRMAEYDALTDGNYAAVWNAITDEGHALAALRPPPQGSPPRPSRTPGYDGAGALADALSGRRDARDVASELYAHGWYKEGDEARQHWLSGLVTSPVGAALAVGKAQASGDKLAMARLALALDKASADGGVMATWKAKGWGAPAREFAGLSKTLRQDAAPKGSKKMATITLGLGKSDPLTVAVVKAAASAQPAGSAAQGRLLASIGEPVTDNHALAMIAEPTPPASPLVTLLKTKLVGPVTVGLAGGAALLGGLWYKYGR